jgi:hypothetical protein
MTPPSNLGSAVGEGFIRLRRINPLPRAGFRLRQPPPLKLWRSRGYGATRDEHLPTPPRASEDFFKLFLGHNISSKEPA